MDGRLPEFNYLQESWMPMKLLEVSGKEKDYQAAWHVSLDNRSDYYQERDCSIS